MKSFVTDLAQGIAKKTTDDYFKSIDHLDPKTIGKQQTALNSYTLYLDAEYSQTKEQTISDLMMYSSDWKKPQNDRTIFVGDLADATYQQIITKHLQNFVNYMKKDNPCPKGKCRQCKFSGVLKAKQKKGIKGYITAIKSYLRFFGLFDTISEKQLQDEVKLPVEIEDEPFPMEKSHIIEIIKETTNFKRRMLYCILSCTGLRIEEACAIRKSNVIFFDENGAECPKGKHHIVGIRTVPEYSKFKRQRTTFVSKEFEDDLLKLCEGTDENSPLFAKNDDPFKAKSNEGQSFKKLRDRLVDRFPVFAEKYTTGTHKITIHSFRSFFVTQTNKIDYGFGHALAGHKQYMARYNRLTSKEKIEYYNRAEKFMSIFTQHGMISEDDLKKAEELYSQELSKINLQMHYQVKKFRDELKELKNENLRLRTMIGEHGKCLSSKT
jgi:integrase